VLSAHRRGWPRRRTGLLRRHRRLRAALRQGPLFAFVEEHWEHERGGQDGSRRHPEPRRNDPCPCGSGRKYKKCCMSRGDAIQVLTSERAAETCAEMVAAASRGLFAVG
jgi:hypothetical protein